LTPDKTCEGWPDIVDTGSPDADVVNILRA
jgi:hypothetical protein